jgi:acyl-CoA dehydrogenase
MVLHGMNAERCLIAGEALGLGYAALIKAVKYAQERVVFGKAIGGCVCRPACPHLLPSSLSLSLPTHVMSLARATNRHQAIQHQLSRAFIELEAAKHLVLAAARSYDAREAAVGAQANAAKYFAAEAAWKACETAVLVHGGMG